MNLKNEVQVACDLLLEHGFDRCAALLRTRISPPGVHLKMPGDTTACGARIKWSRKARSVADPFEVTCRSCVRTKAYVAAFQLRSQEETT